MINQPTSENTSVEHKTVAINLKPIQISDQKQDLSVSDNKKLVTLKALSRWKNLVLFEQKEAELVSIQADLSVN